MDKAVNCIKSEKFHKSRRKKLKSNQSIVSRGVVNDAIQNEKLPINSSEQNSASIIKDKYNVPKSLHKSDESSDATGLFSQLEDEDQSFESMLNNAFEQKRSLQSLLPKKPNVGSVKERKFFKSNKVESLTNVKTIFPLKTSLEAEDVSKVFKIISKPNHLIGSPELRSSYKPILKTYCNPRKSIKNCDIVESFGLPDHSIIPGETKQTRTNSVLDTECIESSEVTIFDMHFQENSWMVTNFNDPQMFNSDELRIKVHPQIITDFSNTDFDYFDSHFTSTPKKKSLKKLQNTSDEEIIGNVKSNDHKMMKANYSNVELKSNLSPINRSGKCHKMLKNGLLSIKYNGIENEEIEMTNKSSKNKSCSVTTKEQLVNVPEINIESVTRYQKYVCSETKRKLRSYNRCDKMIQPLQSQKKGKVTKSRSFVIISKKNSSISRLNKTNPMEYKMYCPSSTKNIQEHSFGKEALSITRGTKGATLINNRIIKDESPPVNKFLSSRCRESSFDTPKINSRLNIQIINSRGKSRGKDKKVQVINKNGLKEREKKKRENIESSTRNYEGFVSKTPLQKLNTSELQIVLTPFNISLLENKKLLNDHNNLKNANFVKSYNGKLNAAGLQPELNSDISKTSNVNHFDIVKEEKSTKNILANCVSKIYYPLKSEICQKNQNIVNYVIEKDNETYLNTKVDTVDNELSSLTNPSVPLDITNKAQVITYSSVEDIQKVEKLVPAQLFSNTKETSFSVITKRLDSEESEHIKRNLNIERVSESMLDVIEINENVTMPPSELPQKTINSNARIYKKRGRKAKRKRKSYDKNILISNNSNIIDKSSALSESNNANLNVLNTISTDQEPQDCMNYLMKKHCSDSVGPVINGDMNGKCIDSDKFEEDLNKVQFSRIKDIVSLESAKVPRKRGRPAKVPRKKVRSAKVPRKRGRPAKVPRKRGRPTKRDILKINQPSKEIMKHNTYEQLMLKSEMTFGFEDKYSDSSVSIEPPMILRKRASVMNTNLSTIDSTLSDTVVKHQNSSTCEQHTTNNEETSKKNKIKKIENMCKPMYSSVPLNNVSEETRTNIRDSIKERDISLHLTETTKVNKPSLHRLKIPSESINVSDIFSTPRKKRGRPRKLCLVSHILEEKVDSNIQPKQSGIKESYKKSGARMCENVRDRKKHIKCSSENSGSTSICSNLSNVCLNSPKDVLNSTRDLSFDFNAIERQTRKSSTNKKQFIEKKIKNKINQSEKACSCSISDSSRLLENKTRKENFINGIILDTVSKIKSYQNDNGSQGKYMDNTKLNEVMLQESVTTETNKNNNCPDIKLDIPIDSADLSNFKKGQSRTNMNMDFIVHNHLSNLNDEPKKYNNYKELDINISQSSEDEKIQPAEVISKNNSVICNKDQQNLNYRSKDITKIKSCPHKSDIFLSDRLRSKCSKNSDKSNESIEDEIPDFKDIIKGSYILRSKSSLGERLKDIKMKESAETSYSQSNIENGTRMRSHSVVPRLYYSTEKNMLKKAIEIDKFKIGSLAWGQIGYHPYWPCLVAKDPVSGQFRKQLSFKNNFQRVLYHVRFFGDNGRRAWISHHRLMPYFNQYDLDTTYEKIKAEPHTKFDLLVYKVKPSNMHKWLTAVEEAEALKTKTLKEKLRFFEEVLSKKIVMSNVSDSILGTNEFSVSKRKYKPEKLIRSNNESHSTTTSVRKSPASKKQKLIISTDLSKKNYMNEPSSELHILNNGNLSTSPLIMRKFDENSEVASKTSSETATTDSDSLETQKVLFKRNNLFRGVSREKVCQHCFGVGEVLKCTSHCNGFYHIDCATEVLNQNINKKKRNTDVQTKSNSIHNVYVSGNKQNCEESTTAIKLNPKHKVDNSKNIIDDHVQIITVPSNIYNTPPRKTFPPNFKNMSLAEQIDYKMKEIMRKFESKTTYAESTTDSSSEENSIQLPTTSLTLPESPIQQIGTNLLLREKELPKSKYTVHVTADSFHVLKQPQKEILKNLPVKLSDRKELIPAESYENRISVCSTSTDNQDFKQCGVEKINPKQFKCGFCSANVEPYCFICHQAISKKGSNVRQKCSLYWCGRFYHPECLKLWPQTQWSLIQTTKPKYSEEAVDSFVCPQHVCHTCASENPRAAMSRCSSDKIVRCLLCPASYHTTNLCIPAGTEILSTTQIICPRHGKHIRTPTINTTWCFLCSEGGNLICCETCPTSVHPECLPVNLTEDDKFICEDCESGRLPLYDEIVWVKLGKYRWWPAVILFPNEVPHNIMNVKHSRGDFVVKFFGTYDYYWVNKGRSFLFQDGDKGCCSNVKKRFDEVFNKAVEEAIVAHKLRQEFKLTQEVESLNSQKPPPYIKIKVNKAVGNVRLLDLDLSNTTPCECDPSHSHPCGPDTDCLNRLLLTECNPEVCPAGQRCKNQSFEKREYPPLVPYKTLSRGWGLKSLAPIKKSQFVIEYVGEMIDDEEYQRRIQKMHEQKEENYYFLTIDKDRMIDAGPKGNLARFMNHCCQPNCETQKWTVNGNTRIGLFATEEIAAETELTFNYNLECIGKEKKVCRCGAPNCSGFIGVKAKQDSEIKKTKKTYRKKKTVEPSILPPCFICNKKENVEACNNKICNKTYHLPCLKLSSWPEGNKFVCPWHNCNMCSKRTIRCCVKCINSFCPSHSDGNIRYDNLLGFVCNSHDPTKPPEDLPIKVKREERKGYKVTDESAVTSTTSDDMDNDYEKNNTPVNQIKTRKTSKGGQLIETDNQDLDVSETVISTPLRKLALQDENEVSSASTSSLDYEPSVKHTMTCKRESIKKKLRLRNIQSFNVTANNSSNTVHVDFEVNTRHNIENK